MALRTQSVIPVVLLRYQQLVRSLSTTHTADNREQKQQQQQQSPIKADANAYEVLGLPESCSEVVIRAAFRKLAKATHPDLQTDTSTAHFIRILAAYEILSDPAKRAEYDKHLRSKLGLGNTQTNASRARETASGYENESAGGGGVNNSGFYGQQGSGASSTEVVSWLKGYRAMVKEMVHRQEIGRGGGGWEEELRWEAQSALRRAYFGPPVNEQEGLPECFEAEERAQPDIGDVLHLVSGRQLFGFVRQVQKPALEGLHEPPFLLLQANELENRSNNNNAPDLSGSGHVDNLDEASDLTRGYHSLAGDNESTDSVRKAVEGTPFVDLELQLFGNVVARSIRVPYQQHASTSSDKKDTDEQDCIYIYLSSEQVEDTSEFVDGTIEDDTKFSRALLGTIRGLRSTGNHNVCFAHAPDGKRTHLILQHTTPLVKYLQWFRIGEESAACECRCRRASTLPSRYWIFEPRTDTHNVGGWYIESFDQTRRSSPRNCRSHLKTNGYRDTDSVCTNEEQRHKMSDLLHPAMYIMAAAYKTLDEEERAAEKREASVPNRIKKLLDLPRITAGFALWWKQKWKPSNFVQVLK